MSDTGEEQAWTMVNKIAALIEERDRIRNASDSEGEDA